MSNYKVKPVYLAVALASLGLDPGGSYARADSLLLEEVVVTATRREESAATIPISITAISSEQLEAFRVENVADVQILAPNFSVFYVVGGSTQPIINIRGILNRASDATVDTTVGVYQDDVFLARGYSVLGQMLDVDRVEVLRGPQGTLFGRNTIGGAVQIVSQAPEIGGDVNGYVRFTAGNYDLYEGKAAATMQLGDSAAVRVAGSLTDRDGYTDSYLVDDTYDPANGQFGYVEGVTPVKQYDTNDADNSAFRVAFAWAPSDQGQLDLSYYRSEADNNGVLSTGQEGDIGGIVDGPTPFGRATAVDRSRYSDFDSGLTPVRTSSESDVDIYIGKYQHFFDNDIGIKFIASYAEAEQSEVFNTDGIVTSGVPLPLVIWNSGDGEVSQSTFELQVTGSTDRFDWIAGLYYFEEDADDRNSGIFRSDLAEGIAGSLPPGFPIPPQLIAFTSSSLVDVNAENESASIFGSVSFELTDDLMLRVGGRYSDDTKGFDGQTVSSSPLLPFDVCAYTNEPVTADNPCTSKGVIPKDEDFDNFSWDISLDYHFNDEIFGFAKVATGYRTGGISLNANSPEAANPFQEDEVISYEMGVKARMGGVVSVDATVFYVDYTDVQQNVNSTSDIACIRTLAPIIVTCNLGDAESKGIELDTSWQVTDSFGLKASYGYVDFEFNDIDRILPYVPEWNYSLTAIYEADIGEVPLRAMLTYSESDEWISTDSLEVEDAGTIDGYSLLDARLTATFGEAFEVSAWGKNLTEDETYSSALTALTPVFFARSAIPAPPRTYGVDFTYRF